MVYAGILAGGIGVRMNRHDLPKQYLSLGNKPIIIHTLEQFILSPQIDKIVVVVPSDWEIYTRDLLEKQIPFKRDMHIITGGENKNRSIMKIVEFIGNEWGINDDDILINHDAIRPFITQRIINDNITTARKYHAVNTALHTPDTIAVSDDGVVINEIIPIGSTYSEQTPQTFNILKLKSAYDNTPDEELIREIDAVRLMLNNGHTVHIVKGERSNIKIVYPYDLDVANALLKVMSD